jgi:tetratricopeptide (TPR) repeat protein
MVDQAVRTLRRRLGERRAVLANTERLPQVLTPSLEALENYRLGLSLYTAGEVEAAQGPLREAVSQDTAFAEAWITLAQVLNYLNKPDSASAANRNALRYRDRLSEARRADRVFVDRMALDVAQWDAAFREREAFLRKNSSHIGNYALYLACCAGRPDSALIIYKQAVTEGTQRARRFDPGREVSYCWANPILYATALDRADEWLNHLDTLGVSVPPSCERDIEFFESLANADWDLAEGLRDAARGTWTWRNLVESSSYQLQAARGRIARARQELMASGTANALLLLDVLYPTSMEGDARTGGVLADIIDEAPDRSADGMRRLILRAVREALVGDTAEANRLSRHLQATRSAATSRAFENSYLGWLSLLDTGPAFRRQDWAVVLAGLEPLENRLQDSGIGNPVAGDLYLTRWLLAEAQERSGDRGSAIETLESILERPTSRINGWQLQGFIHPPARLKLGRLFAQVGNTAKAREHLEAFLSTFNDPDPEYEWMVEEAQEFLEGLNTSGS